MNLNLDTLSRCRLRKAPCRSCPERAEVFWVTTNRLNYVLGCVVCGYTELVLLTDPRSFPDAE